MASIKQIHALLLEEALLHLIRNSGYQTVENAAGDKTLNEGKSGLEIQGRGEKHQIDAIADYKVTPPFCNPLRLLVEGKFEKNNTGIGVVRNAVGVLKDLQEYFTPGSDFQDPSKSRFHYTYAIFSASKYTKGAQRYAYAQDIYLIPVSQSRFFETIFNSIRDIKLEDFGNLSNGNTIDVSLKKLREQVRISLKNSFNMSILNDIETLIIKFRKYVDECKRIDMAFLAIAGKSFPILLIKNPEVSIDQIETPDNIRIHWDKQGWYVSNNGTRLFSFDLPKELFDLYEKNGLLSNESALDLKQNQLYQFKILIEKNNEMKYLILNLDKNWISHLIEKHRLENDNRESMNNGSDNLEG